ncbi:hypothetical protein OUZ56_021442 [Daphnia magna]|uniref:Uncharacterized protein n=1 Tax=Daphnia magna TaxID=35525 RepID=A0ABQ9ZHD6_9CRUS|nr:hypothetical protein OUZ56_021442 [Daphnia magna]
MTGEQIHNLIAETKKQKETSSIRYPYELVSAISLIALGQVRQYHKCELAEDCDGQQQQQEGPELQAQQQQGQQLRARQHQEQQQPQPECDAVDLEY